MKKPIVSVIVITYNSEKFILQTLESIKLQNAKNIELIISDDNSLDNTVELCENWIEKNKYNFLKAIIIKSKINTGIVENCNRGVYSSKGEWIKLLAGDDFLKENYILNTVKYINNNPLAKLIVSKVIAFKDTDTVLFEWPKYQLPKKFKSQLYLLLNGGFIKAAGVIVKKELLIAVGGFDNSFPLLEDDPLWLKCILNGDKFYYNQDASVYYRIHDNSISNPNIQGLDNSDFINSLTRFKKEKIFPLMLKKKMYFLYLQNQFRMFINKKIRQNALKPNTLYVLCLINRLNEKFLRVYSYVVCYFIIERVNFRKLVFRRV